MQERMQENMFAELVLTQLVLPRVRLTETELRWHYFQNLQKIKDDKIVEKKTLSLPKEIHNVVSCKNPRCISSIEQELEQVFVLTDPVKGIYRCKYCEEQYRRHKKITK